MCTATTLQQFFILDQAAAAEVKPTDDVDIVVELANYTGYMLIEEQLRKKGFVNNTASEISTEQDISYSISGIIHPDFFEIRKYDYTNFFFRN